MPLTAAVFVRFRRVLPRLMRHQPGWPAGFACAAAPPVLRASMGPRGGRSQNNGPGADHAVKGNRLVVRSGPGLRVGPRTAVFGPSGQIRIIALQFKDLRCLGQVFRTASVASERDASSHPVARTGVADRRWREDPLGAVDALKQTFSTLLRRINLIVVGCHGKRGNARNSVESRGK